MNRLTEKMFENAPFGYFSSRDVAVLFGSSPDTRYGLIKRALAAGEIIQIRRGLYCLAPKYQKKKINLYALAEHIYGPSYISLESALRWHGWIPEAVYALTSASMGRSKEFKTPLGVFSYSRVPQKIFFAGVDRLTDDAGDVFLMASALKALADYVYVYRKDWVGIGPACESLRIEAEELESINAVELERLIANCCSRRVERFLQGVRKDLKL
ncbi:MAG: type IV toxin-antitoxin system AbiEi family antitoxin domain-containing protein [Planctomycetaceae bacterium]|nr:type IV toxin-antitoxin system AbiEi family antitoxin domain-containing protein [Planctomycetaceae bacterium]